MSQHINESQFESTWKSLRTNNYPGSFEYSTPTKPFNEAVTSHFRLVDNRKRYGVYIIRQQKSGEVLYIGKGGTINRHGDFKQQDIPNRLKAERGKIRSNEWFSNLCKKKGGILIEYIFLPEKPESPAFVEARLLQAFLNEFGILPEMNKAF